MKYVLNIDPETNRVLSAGIMPHPPADALMVDTLPDGDLLDYLYINGEYVYDPLPEPEPVEPKPTNSQRLEALEQQMTALIGGVTDVQ